METVIDKDVLVNNLLAEAEVLIKQGKDFLMKEGKVLKFTEWLSIADYAKKYNVSTQTVSKWIARGVIPEDAYIDIPEIGKKLVRDRPYATSR